MGAGWVLFALTLALGWRAASAPSPLHDGRALPRSVDAAPQLSATERATIALFEENRRSVVHIATSERRLARGLYSYDVLEVPRGTGSGFIWSDDGYVVTNYHVVEQSTGRRVTLADGSEYPGRYVGGDPAHDIAVLKIDAPRETLRALAIGTSDDLLVGQNVYAIGNPFGYDWTLTTGVISGLDRVILSPAGVRIRGVIQTDAAINPGNSGGPLLDGAGRLIGVNAAIVSPSGSSAGLGFAVPVDTINRIVPQIIRYGVPARAGLGVSLVSDARTRSAGLEGVIIGEVPPGSAAARAGLRPLSALPGGGVQLDLVVGIDGHPVRASRDLLEILGDHDPGDRVVLSVQREGRVVEVPVVLQELPR